MQRRVPQGEQEFEQLVHALPTDWEDMMRELGAFTYAGKIQSHEGLRVPFCSMAGQISPYGKWQEY